MIEWLLLLALGAGAGVYVYLAYPGITIMGVSVSGLIGTGSAYIINMYTDMIEWFKLGMQFTDIWATLFLIGYCAFCFVLLGNIALTATDNKKGITAIL